MTGLIVHEWIESHGGSENVVDAMVDSFPDAEIRCLWSDAHDRFPSNTVHESWMAKTPLRRNKAVALPLMPWTWAGYDLGHYDFVLVSSHLFAHHIGGSPAADGPRKYVYVHTPARYIWAPELDARGGSLLARAAIPLLKRVDRARAGRGAVFAANSEFVRERVRASWDQDAVVIYPPVEIDRLQSVKHWRDRVEPFEEAILDGLPAEFVLGASRFVPYKRLDLVIEAGAASGMPVVLAGSGSQRAELEALAATSRTPVYFVDRPSDALLYALYQAASVLVFPAIEDFGIMPVEAMCLGTPTIVSRRGGASESVDALHGGVVLDSFSAESMKQGVDSALRVEMANARERANPLFGRGVFAERLANWMAQTGEPVAPQYQELS